MSKDTQTTNNQVYIWNVKDHTDLNCAYNFCIQFITLYFNSQTSLYTTFVLQDHSLFFEFTLKRKILKVKEMQENEYKWEQRIYIDMPFVYIRNSA